MRVIFIGTGLAAEAVAAFATEVWPAKLAAPPTPAKCKKDRRFMGPPVAQALASSLVRLSSPHRQWQRVVIIRIRRLGISGRWILFQFIQNHLHRPLQLRVVPRSEEHTSELPSLRH